MASFGQCAGCAECWSSMLSHLLDPSVCALCAECRRSMPRLIRSVWVCHCRLLVDAPPGPSVCGGGVPHRLCLYGRVLLHGRDGPQPTDQKPHGHGALTVRLVAGWGGSGGISWYIDHHALSQHLSSSSLCVIMLPYVSSSTPFINIIPKWLCVIIILMCHHLSSSSLCVIAIPICLLASPSAVTVPGRNANTD